MASPETLNINLLVASWAGAGYSNVDITDLEEAIASADGDHYGPGPEDDPADFGLTASEVVDSDTVTNVSITVRLQANGTAAAIQADIDFLIGGSVQGAAVDTGNLTGSFANYGPLNDAGWNSDWTAAQMDGAEVRITPRHSGMPGTVEVDIDCMDVVVTFTPAGVGSPWNYYANQ